MLCPACALDQLTPLADLGEMPVACGMTFPSPQAARTSLSGRMSLAHCAACGHVANIAFDPQLGHFDATFEAALFHSPTYTAYATGVVDRLVKRYDLVGKKVLEVASGSPVLLAHLTDLGCEPTGVPGSDPEDGTFDLILARFVLEHMADPGGLLTQLRKASQRAFIEVPDAGYDLTTAGWDCIYPHVGYFGSTSLQALCARTGWRIVESGKAFHDQYLWAEIEACAPTTPAPAQVPPLELTFAAATSHWQTTLTGHKAVVWGAGTRGTMFCNRVDPRAGLIAGVVDRNPGKHGRFLPITGHRVLSPTDLTTLQPDTVILTNPAYRDEIAAELATMDVTATVLVA
ncbi:MAG TPA: hypothetical protein DGT23_05225 [Micromonosporaceae bacterium]|nr:hypothetical protein [Micromonosporaceae bacterium]